MTSPTVRKTVSTVETTEYSLGREGLIDVLRRAGIIPQVNPSDPTEKIDLFIRVPGGGDYSNSRLDIDDGCGDGVPLEVVITRSNQTTS